MADEVMLNREKKTKPTGLVFRPVCFKSLLIAKKDKGQKGSAVLIASA
jgi:hypothetical protein